MPRVNTTSLREEFARLQGEFKRLSAEGKVSADVRLLLQGLMAIVDIMVAIFLEKSLVKTNKNSSKPSSQTEKDESATLHGSKGKGRRESDEQFSNSRTKETVRISSVDSCEACGESLTRTPCDSYERRTKVDIVFEKVVEHIDAEIKQCPNCGCQAKGKFPQDMPGPLQYGNGLKAYLINLVVCQMVALNRIQRLVATMIGVTISESSIVKYVMQLHNSLENWENSAREALLRTKAIHCDETSHRVNKKNYWVHVYSSGDLTLKYLHRKRGLEAMEELNIIPRYGGVIVHDCWTSYLSYKNCQHALCGSHLLRELAAVIESNGYSWARAMKRLLQGACRAVSQSNSKRLSQRDYANLRKWYRSIITRGEKELPEIPIPSDGRRGRIAKSDAHNLLERLKIYENEVLLFAQKPYVAFTNNRAERDLRMGKVKQKVSGCFRSEDMAKAYCRISSYLSTMANRGHNPLIAIQMALAGKAPLEIGGE